MKSQLGIRFAAFVFGGFLCATAAAQHAGDIWVARNASDQLDRGGFDNFAIIKELSPTAGGWIDSNPGLDHLAMPRPDLGLDLLEAGSQIRLEVIELDPALKVIQVGTFITLENPGDSFVLRPAGPQLHEHPFWFVDEEDSAFDPTWTIWHGTFKLVDVGATGYIESEPFVMKFSVAPILVGDMNCDGALSVSDIGPFVTALTNPAQYAIDFPDCDVILADINDDGAVTVSDIGGFVALLTG